MALISSRHSASSFSSGWSESDSHRQVSSDVFEGSISEKSAIVSGRRQANTISRTPACASSAASALARRPAPKDRDLCTGQVGRLLDELPQGSAFGVVAAEQVVGLLDAIDLSTQPSHVGELYPGKAARCTDGAGQA